MSTLTIQGGTRIVPGATTMPPLTDVLAALAAELQALHPQTAVDHLADVDHDNLNDLHVAVAPRYPDGKPALETEAATRTANRYTCHAAVIVQRRLTDTTALAEVETVANTIFAALDRRRLTQYPTATPRPPEMLAAPSPEHLARRVACFVIAIDYRVIA